MKHLRLLKHVNFKGVHYECNTTMYFEEDDANLLISKNRAREDLTPLTNEEYTEACQASWDEEYDLP